MRDTVKRKVKNVIITMFWSKIIENPVDVEWEQSFCWFCKEGISPGLWEKWSQSINEINKNKRNNNDEIRTKRKYVAFYI